MTALGLEDVTDHLTDELSGGQQQRVAIARGLAQRATVLIADEPTSDLDSTNRELVMALLRNEADRGAIVVISTHDPDTAQTCDRQIHLVEGHPTWTDRASKP